MKEKKFIQVDRMILAERATSAVLQGETAAKHERYKYNRHLNPRGFWFVLPSAPITRFIIRSNGYWMQKRSISAGNPAMYRIVSQEDKYWLYRKEALVIVCAAERSFYKTRWEPHGM